MTLRRIRSAAMILLVTLGSAAAAIAHRQIVPLRTEIYFSRTASTAPSNVPIKDKSGKELYVLALHPDYAVGNILTGLELVLKDASDSDLDENLLWPCENCHGLQAFMFPANGLRFGADESIFGPHRVMFVKSRGIVVRVDILDSKVSPTAGADSGFQLDLLHLRVAVENLPASDRAAAIRPAGADSSTVSAAQKNHRPNYHDTLDPLSVQMREVPDVASQQVVRPSVNRS